MHLRFFRLYKVSCTISDKATCERETEALVKLSSFLDCKRLMIITRNEERTINVGGKDIEAIPAWKWLSMD